MFGCSLLSLGLALGIDAELLRFLSSPDHKYHRMVALLACLVRGFYQGIRRELEGGFTVRIPVACYELAVFPGLYTHGPVP